MHFSLNINGYDIRRPLKPIVTRASAAKTRSWRYSALNTNTQPVLIQWVLGDGMTGDKRPEREV
jgi:hypothetical protein